jgi:hypothetical protein
MHRRALARFLVIARIAVAMGCFQLSGYGHMVTDLLETFGVLEEHSDDCSDEGDRECPPGCPTCHCVHCVTPALPAPAVSDMLAPPIATSIASMEAPRRTPASPDLPHVYRPPRATVSFT